MQFNANQIERMRGGKLAIAAHKGQLGWCLFNDDSFFKGSSTPQELTSEALSALGAIGLAELFFLAPAKDKQDDVRIIANVVQVLSALGISKRRIMPTALIEHFDAAAAPARIIRQAMDTISPCADNAAALALATCIVSRLPS